MGPGPHRVPPGTPQGGRPAPRGAALELAALGLALTGAVLLLARTPAWFENLGRFQLLALGAFVIWTLAMLRAPRYAAVPRAGRIVFAVALATRALLVPVPPSLSDDLHRYRWEGRVLLAGGDPWRQAPLDPALAPLRDALVWPRVNHPGLATIYPPLAQAGFALVAAVSPTVTAFKAWIALHDLALVGVLLAWAARAGVSPVAVAAYAWNPLVLIEYAGTGHNDPTALLWLGLAFLFAKSRPTAAALALAAGCLVKLAPLVAVPFLLRDWPWRARLAALVPIGAGLGWFLLHGRGPASGLGAYWESWRNNDLIFHYLERGFGDFATARTAAAALLLLVLAWAWRRRLTPWAAAQAGVRAGALLSPVLHPWYLGWVLMFEPLSRSAGWLALSATALLNYGVFATPREGRAHHPALATRWVEYGVPLALAGAAAVARRGRGSGEGAGVR